MAFTGAWLLLVAAAASAQEAPPPDEHGDAPTADVAEADADPDALRDLSLVDLLNVSVVSASLKEERAAEAPAIVSVITRDDFADYMFSSVAEALQYQPGFYVIYDWVNYNVGVRGVNGGMGAQSQVLKTMIAGRDARFRPTAGSLLGPELIPTSAIKQVEVIRGPVSALYGADAFLGAINVIPLQASDMGEGHVRVNVTPLLLWNNWGLQSDVNVWGNPFGIDSIVSLSVRNADRTGLRLPESSPAYVRLRDGLGTTKTAEDEELTASGFAQLKKSWGSGSLTADANLQYYDRTAAFHFESSALSDARVSFYNMGTTLRLEQSIIDNLQLRAFVAYSRGAPTPSERLVDRIRGNVDHLERTLEYQSVENRLELTYSDELLSIPFAVTGGADFVFDDANLQALTGIRSTSEEPLVISPPVSVQFNNFGGFAQLQVKPFPWLSVLGGARIENHSLYGTQYSYRAAVSFAYENWSAKLLYGRSFKAPSMSLLYAVPVIRGGPEANPALQPQYAETGEAYVGYSPFPWLSLGLSAYVSSIEGLAQISTDAFLPRAENRADLLLFGGELEVKVAHLRTGIEGFASVSVNYNEQTQQLANGRTVTNPASLYPHVTAGVGLQYRLRRYFVRFFVTDRVASERRADDSNIQQNSRQEYYLPAYNILSFGVASDGLEIFPGRETIFALKGDNILAQKYVEPGFLGIDIPGERWSAKLSITQQF